MVLPDCQVLQEPLAQLGHQDRWGLRVALDQLARLEPKVLKEQVGSPAAKDHKDHLDQ